MGDKFVVAPTYNIKTLIDFIFGNTLSCKLYRLKLNNVILKIVDVLQGSLLQSFAVT